MSAPPPGAVDASLLLHHLLLPCLILDAGVSEVQLLQHCSCTCAVVIVSSLLRFEHLPPLLLLPLLPLRWPTAVVRSQPLPPPF